MTIKKEKRVYKSVLALSMVVVFVLAGIMPAMYAEAATDYWEDNGTDVWNTNSGNVGIGTNTPTEILMAEKTQSTDTSIAVKNEYNAGPATR